MARRSKKYNTLQFSSKFALASSCYIYLFIKRSRVLIAMDPSAKMLSVFVFAVMLASSAATADVNSLSSSHTDMTEFIKTSCKVTLYSQLCVSSLSSYAGSLKAKQSDLVKAAVTVSLVNARNVSVWAAGLKARGAMTIMSERESAALKDCIGNFRDATYEITGSLAQLKRLNPNTFQFQMSNVETWMSAALTDQDSCLNGFQDLNTSGKVTAMVTGRVQNVCKLISNALALVNKFAATGVGYK